MSGHRRRLEGNKSSLRHIFDRFFKARNESLRMNFAASAHIFDHVVHGARVVIRQMTSVRESTKCQGPRIGRAWLAVWERLRAAWVKEVKVDEESLEQSEEEEKDDKEDKENEL